MNDQLLNYYSGLLSCVGLIVLNVKSCSRYSHKLEDRERRSVIRDRKNCQKERGTVLDTSKGHYTT